MREDGKLDYLELPAANLPATKQFYSQAFGWTFVDYGRRIDWSDPKAAEGAIFLRRATEIKNIWVPYGE